MPWMSAAPQYLRGVNNECFFNLFFWTVQHRKWKLMSVQSYPLEKMREDKFIPLR